MLDHNRDHERDDEDEVRRAHRRSDFLFIVGVGALIFVGFVLVQIHLAHHAVHLEEPHLEQR